VTEIPEHLLKRSKERRSAMGLGEADTADAAQAAAAAATAPSGAAAPARVESAAPATKAGGAPPKAPTEPPKPVAAPEPPYIQAAKRRKKIPFWAAPVLAGLPLWGFMYMEAMSPPKVEVTGPLAEGATLYSQKCASCHLAGGAGDANGGVGRALWQGEVLLTFPDIADQVAYIRHGSFAAGTPYGDPAREGGPHVARGGMPAHPQSVLSDEELTDIVCYTRIELSGADEADYADYCSEGATLMVQADDEGNVVEAEKERDH
jgi:mono/diheme cytochrome c family protein